MMSIGNKLKKLTILIVLTYLFCPLAAKGARARKEVYTQRIQKFAQDGRFITSLRTSISGTNIFDDVGISVDSLGNIYIADLGNKYVQKYAPDGSLINQWRVKGYDDKYPHFTGLGPITVDKGGNIYVGVRYTGKRASEYSARISEYTIQKFSSDGNFVDKWVIKASTGGSIYGIDGLVADAADNIYVLGGEWFPDASNCDRYGNVIYKSERVDYYIWKFAPDGSFISRWSELHRDCKKGAVSTWGNGIATDNFCNIYVVDAGEYSVRKFTSDGEILQGWLVTKAEQKYIYRPNSITADNMGNVYVGDERNNSIQKFSGDGELLKEWGTKGSMEGQFFHPCGITTDNSGNIYVLDWDRSEGIHVNAQLVDPTRKSSSKAQSKTTAQSDIPMQSSGKDNVAHTISAYGYKNAKWGMIRSQVSESLNITLSRHYGIGVFGTKPTNQTFYGVWGVPKDELWGRIQYRKSMIPTKSFEHFENPDGDRCLFYKDKFCCYYFDVSAKNYDVYYKKLASKYGSPSASNSFPGYDTDGSKRYDISVKRWDEEETRTTIFLIKSVFSAYELGMKYTSVTMAYFSADFFGEISGAIQAKIKAKGTSEQQKREASINRDLDKIQ